MDHIAEKRKNIQQEIMKDMIWVYASGFDKSVKCDKYELWYH